jgi:hypothetical protein
MIAVPKAPALHDHPAGGEAPPAALRDAHSQTRLTLRGASGRPQRKRLVKPKCGLRSRRLRRTSLRDKLHGIPNTDVLAAIIPPCRHQPPVSWSVGTNPLTLDNTFDVVGIGEKADRIANSEWGLRRWHDR